MKRFSFITLIVLAVSNPLLSEEKKAAGEEMKEEKITFVDHVLPIFRQRCGSCHNANDRKGGLIVDQYAPIMEGGSSGAVIEPGDAEFSYLWLLINHEDTPKMPPNADKLPENELAMIRKWIDLGALENAGSKANIKKKASLAKIEVTTERPAEVAMPLAYLGEPPHVLKDSVNAVTALTTSPWAPITAVSGYQQVGLYHSETLDSLGTLPFPEGQPQILKFSRNGDLLLVGGGRGGQLGKVVIYDVKTGERKAEVGNEYDEVLAADISPDQSLIALGGPKRMLRVYSTATGELVYEQKKHTDWITAIEFSPDGVLLASGDRSNGLIVWESDTGSIFYDLLGHRGSVNDISWRPDSNVVASASEDGTVKLWEMQNGGNIKSWNAHGGGVSAMDYTREGNIVTIGRDKVARLWNGDGGKLKDFGGFTDIGMEVAYDAETKRVFGGDWTGMIQVFNSEDAVKVGEIDTNPPTIEMVLATVEPELQRVAAEHAAKAKALADLNKKLADRKAAADKAVAVANQAKAEAEKSTAAKNAATKAVADKKGELAQTNENVAATKKAVDQSNVALQNAQKEAAAAKVKLDQQQAQLNQITAAVKTAGEGASKLAETYQFAVNAAKPTPEEQAVIDKDPAVKAAVAMRQALVKEVEANLTFSKLLVEKTQKQLADAQKSFAAVNAVHMQKIGLSTKAQEMAQQAQADYANAMKAQTAAQEAVKTAESNLATTTANEKNAIAKMAAEKATADKLVAAANPTADEGKLIQTLTAEINAIAARMNSIKERVNKLKAAQAQVANATAKAG